MNIDLLLDNFLNPPILFFFLGILAVFVRSNLEIPQPLPKLFSLYLLFAIGFQGGVKLAANGLTAQVIWTLSAAVAVASLTPLAAYPILRRRLPPHDAAAIAATYGSISAVTFITASSFLDAVGIAHSGYMVAAMALMESPAIIVGVGLVRFAAPANGTRMNWGELLRDSFFNGSVFLLVGSLIIGALTGYDGAKALAPFSEDIFKGMLTFFLLDMGLIAARRLRDLRAAGVLLVSFALLFPVVNALLGIGIAALLGLPAGDALLFAVLCASASYIAVPAALRIAVPEANPSLYLPMALAITFPFNILAGIPAYLALIQALW